jgi:hypothetical protein
MLDVIHYSMFNTYYILGVGLTPVFRCLVTITVTDFFIVLIFKMSGNDQDQTQNSFNVKQICYPLEPGILYFHGNICLLYGTFQMVIISIKRFLFLNNTIHITKMHKKGQFQNDIFCS